MVNESQIPHPEAELGGETEGIKETIDAGLKQMEKTVDEAQDEKSQSLLIKVKNSVHNLTVQQKQKLAAALGVATVTICSLTALGGSAVYRAYEGSKENKEPAVQPSQEPTSAPNHAESMVTLTPEIEDVRIPISELLPHYVDVTFGEGAEVLAQYGFTPENILEAFESGEIAQIRVYSALGSRTPSMETLKVGTDEYGSPDLLFTSGINIPVGSDAAVLMSADNHQLPNNGVLSLLEFTAANGESTSVVVQGMVYFQGPGIDIIRGNLEDNLSDVGRVLDLVLPNTVSYQQNLQSFLE